MATNFLTSSKVALAFLIRFYCNGFAPPDVELPILQLLISYIDLENTHVANRQSRSKLDPSNRFPISSDVESLRLAYKANITSSKVSHPNETNVWHGFEEYLCRIRSLDVFLDEIKNLQYLFADVDEKRKQDDGSSANMYSQSKGLLLGIKIPMDQHRVTKLTSWSMFGVFIRRVMLEFEKLSFDDAMRIWRSFKLYRQPLMQALGDHESSTYEPDDFIAGEANDKMSLVIHDFMLDRQREHNQISSADIEKILEFQINQMQRDGAKLPPNVKTRIETIIGSAPHDSNLLNYVNFLQSWYKGDYTSSFEFLHRYYDYAMQHTDRFHYQYALLNMAILQADFGSFDEATAAMKEAIGTARENKDMHCLNYCLSWLYHFCVQHEESSSNMIQKVLQGADGGQGIRYLKNAAREYDMHSVEAQVMLLEAGQALKKGHQPLEALEKLYEASYLILNHQLENVKASQVLLHSSVYAGLGITVLSRSTNNLIPECYSPYASQEEIVNARCRNAYFDALVGKYKSALDILTDLQKRDLNVKLDQLLAHYIGVIQLKKMLHHHELYEAERLIAALKSGSSSSIDLAFIVELAEVNLQIQFGNLSQALSLIETMFQKTGDSPHVDSQRRMKLLNTKALILAQTGRPQKGFSIAMRSVTAAYQANNATMLWESVAALVGVLVGMGEWDAATAIAGSSIYRATEIEDLAVVALLRKVGIDALVGRTGTLGDEASRRKNMRLALEWIQEARNMYKQLEDYKAQCDMNAKARMILTYLGDVQAAQELESEFKRIETLITA